MKTVAMYTPPKNMKIDINNRHNVKCIKIEDTSWINIEDFADMSKQEIIPFLKNNPEIYEHCLEFNYWGAIDYYIDANEGLCLLDKKLKEQKTWY